MNTTLKDLACHSSNKTLIFLLCSFLSGLTAQHVGAAAVEFDTRIPQCAFAANELDVVLKEIGKKDLRVSLIINRDESSPEGFQIRSAGPNSIEVVGVTLPLADRIASESPFCRGLRRPLSLGRVEP